MIVMSCASRNSSSDSMTVRSEDSVMMMTGRDQCTPWRKPDGQLHLWLHLWAQTPPGYRRIPAACLFWTLRDLHLTCPAPTGLVPILRPSLRQHLQRCPGTGCATTTSPYRPFSGWLAGWLCILHTPCSAWPGLALQEGSAASLSHRRCTVPLAGMSITRSVY